ncbi:hypothetical protein D3C72_1727060 [compost metagenome]
MNGFCIAGFANEIAGLEDGVRGLKTQLAGDLPAQHDVTLRADVRGATVAGGAQQVAGDAIHAVLGALAPVEDHRRTQ